MFLLDNLSIPIFVVCVEDILGKITGIHGGCWLHTLSWRGQLFLSDHIFNQFFLQYSSLVQSTSIGKFFPVSSMR